MRETRYVYLAVNLLKPVVEGLHSAFTSRERAVEWIAKNSPRATDGVSEYVHTLLRLPLNPDPNGKKL